MGRGGRRRAQRVRGRMAAAEEPEVEETEALRTASTATLDIEDGEAAAAILLDATDPLKAFREKFVLPTPAPTELFARYIYFDGNSLGLQPKAAAAAIQDAVNDWAMQGATSTFELNGVGYGGIESRRNPQQDRCSQQAVAMVGAANAAEICWMNVRLPVHVSCLKLKTYWVRCS